MSDQQAFEKLKTFFETHPTSREASSHLKARIDIGVVIAQNVECAFYKDENGSPHFERRTANHPDFIFWFSPEAVESLVIGEYPTMADVAIAITKNFLAGNVKFKYIGTPINFFSRGYLGVLKAGGIEYARFLSNQRLPTLDKIKELLFKR